jgi:glycosyltransferase involved in cell wall biosynthesis
VGLLPQAHVDDCARWIFISETTRRVALEAGYALPGSTVISAGVDPGVFRPRPLEEWSGRLLYAGRLDPRKGAATIVEALTDLTEARLRVVSGDDPDALRAHAAELGVSDRVEFGPGLGHRDLAEAYAESDVVVFPVTWAEPWGLVPLEAMSVGRPVVATGTGGSGEYLEDGANCLLFPPGDAGALAGQIRRLASDTALARRLRSGGLETVARHTSQQSSAAIARELERAASG